MIQDEITDVLLRARIPASTKGFLYIHDALEIMDQDPYYFSGKVCALYTKIAKQHGASFSQVERAIRYAFKSALTHGDSKSVEHYLDPVNTQNSNELKVLEAGGTGGTSDTENFVQQPVSLPRADIQRDPGGDESFGVRDPTGRLKRHIPSESDIKRDLLNIEMGASCQNENGSKNASCVSACHL